VGRKRRPGRQPGAWWGSKEFHKGKSGKKPGETAIIAKTPVERGIPFGKKRSWISRGQRRWKKGEKIAGAGQNWESQRDRRKRKTEAAISTIFGGPPTNRGSERFVEGGKKKGWFGTRRSGPRPGLRGRFRERFRRGDPKSEPEKKKNAGRWGLGTAFVRGVQQKNFGGGVLSAVSAGAREGGRKKGLQRSERLKSFERKSE